MATDHRAYGVLPYEADREYVAPYAFTSSGAREQWWPTTLPGINSEFSQNQDDGFEGKVHEGVPYRPVWYDDVSFDDTERDDVESPPTQYAKDDDALAWMQSAPVQAALAAVGHPDGSPGWTHEFARHLLGYVDAVEKIKTDDLAMPVAIEAINTWNWHLNQLAGEFGMIDGWSGNRPTKISFWARMPREIPTLLLSHTVAGRTMSFDNCAWLLGVTPNQLEECIWSRSDRAALYLAAETLDCYEGTLLTAATQHNLSVKTLSSYMRLRRGRTLQPGASTLSDADFATSLRWIDEDGLSRREAYDRLLALGCVPSSYRPDSYFMRIYRSTKRAA